MGKRGCNTAGPCRPAPGSFAPDDEVEWQTPASPAVQPEDDGGAWPPGPRDAEGLFNWPQDLLRSTIADPVRRSRLLDVVQRGVAHVTDYSGMDSPREVCFMIEQAMRAEFAWGEDVPKPLLRFLRSCDWGKVQQEVLVKISAAHDDSTSCVFPSLEARLPEEASALLDSMQPGLGDEGSGRLGKPAKKAKFSPGPALQGAESAYDDMAAWLAKNKHWVFSKDAVSACLVHGKTCPATPPQPNDLPSAVRVNWAGTTCTGWTAIGQQLRYADPSERCHAVWLAERQQKALDGTEDMFFQENVPKYPFKLKLREPLSDTHDIIRVAVGPEDLGWPSRRKRSLCCGLVRSRWRWCGPTSDQAVQAEFDMIFKRATTLSGNCFLLAPLSEVQEWYKQKLAKRGVHVAQDEPLDIASLLEDILPPGARLRLDAYKEILEQDSGATDFIADVEQWPNHGAAYGSLFPCQLTHGTVLSLRGGTGPRVFLGSEHLAALGWHIFSGSGDKFCSPIGEILRSLPGHTQKALSGNAMALPAIAAFVLFIWSNVEQLRHPSQESEGGTSSPALTPDQGKHHGNGASVADAELGRSKLSCATNAGDVVPAGSSKAAPEDDALAAERAELESTQEWGSEIDCTDWLPPSEFLNSEPPEASG